MIGIFLYVRDSRLDGMLEVEMAKRLQYEPRETHVPVVKRIFK